MAAWERGKARPLARRYGSIVRFLGYDPEPAGDTLGGRLRAVRLRLGLSQEELAARTGLDEGTIVDLERNRRSPSKRTRRKISSLLQATADESLGSS